MKLIVFTRQDNIEVKFKTSLKDVENLDENFVINNIKLNTFLEQNLFYCFDKKQWTLNEILFFAKNNLMLVRIYDETESTLLKTYDETNPIPYPTTTTTTTAAPTTTTTTAAVTKTIKYGRLYNWFAVTDPRGIAPSGWHVPTDAEWDTLRIFADKLADGYGAHRLKTVGNTYWSGDNSLATNEFQFSAVGAGDLFISNSGVLYYINLREYTEWWSAEGNCANVKSDAYGGFDLIRTGDSTSSDAISIRLIKDDGINEGPVTIDGDLYTAVTIGNQVWIQQNLAVTHYQNGDLIGSDFTGTSGAVTAYDNDELNVYI